MLHLRRKKKTPLPLDEKRLREVVKEELETHDATLDAKNKKERERQAKLDRLRRLPKSKRRQLARYLRKRGENER